MDLQKIQTNLAECTALLQEAKACYNRGIAILILSNYNKGTKLKLDDLLVTIKKVEARNGTLEQQLLLEFRKN
jgi:bifunctional ADP-heptose synthase (sugar kinase/adenylyltransferase)